MVSKMLRRKRRISGQTLVEYGLLVSLIALVVISILTVLSWKIRDVYSRVNTTKAQAVKKAPVVLELHGHIYEFTGASSAVLEKAGKEFASYHRLTVVEKVSSVHADGTNCLVLVTRGR